MGFSAFQEYLRKINVFLRFECAQVTESVFDRTIVAVMPAKMSSDQAARGVGTGKVMEVSLNTCNTVAKMTLKLRL